MSCLWIHPAFADDLKQLGLTAPGDFLDLQGPILGGHPDRHVRRVELLRACAPPIVGYLKREHRIRWRDRFANALGGRGWISKSVREARVLLEAARAGIGCPQVIAYGAERRQAFVLVENLDMADLRKYAKAFPRQRLQVAHALGIELARLHAAGFQHSELYAKHVLIRQDGAGYRFAFLDWQLANSHRRLGVRQRGRDLAALHATLSEELASPAVRLTFLRAYRQGADIELPPVTDLARIVESHAMPLLAKRRIRELRQMPLPHLSQNLIWLDGEALCVTLDFWKELDGQVPRWLKAPAPPSDWPRVEERLIPHAGRALHLTRRWFTPPLLPTLPLRKGTTFPAPEFEQVGALVRLQRFGLRGPRLLAMGHRDIPRFGKYSFLLVEAIEEARPLEEVPSDADWRERFFALLGPFLRRVHEAGYGLKQSPFEPLPHWGVVDEWEEEEEIVLLRLDGLERTDQLVLERLRQDLRWILPAASWVPDEKTLARLVQGYLGRQRWTAEAGALLASLSDFLSAGERQVV